MTESTETLVSSLAEELEPVQRHPAGAPPESRGGIRARRDNSIWLEDLRGAPDRQARALGDLRRLLILGVRTALKAARVPDLLVDSSGGSLAGFVCLMGRRSRVMPYVANAAIPTRA